MDIHFVVKSYWLKGNELEGNVGILYCNTILMYDNSITYQVCYSDFCSHSCIFLP